MKHDYFVKLVKKLDEKDTLPEVLEILKGLSDSTISECAKSLTGQFSLCEIDGEKRIYHVEVRESDDPEQEAEEYAEWIMNEGDDVIKFIAWFFDAMFSIEKKDVYTAAGKTYTEESA